MAVPGNLIAENYYDPYIRDNRGFNTNYPIKTSSDLTVGGTITAAGQSYDGAQTITAKSANALSVGPNGNNNPVLNVNTNTTSAATGLSITGAAAGSGVAEQVITSGTNESMTLDAAGTGTIGLNTLATASGLVTVGNSTSLAGLAVNGPVTSGADAITATSATALSVGLGQTHPAFVVNTNTASSATGLQVTSAAAAGGVAAQVITSGTNESLTVDAAAAGTVGINTKATTAGLVTIGNSTSKAGLAVNGNVSSNGILMPTYSVYLQSETLAAATFAASTSYPFWTAPNTGETWQIVAMSARYTTGAGSAATFQVEVASAATAPGSGTAQNSTGVALNGTANTTVNATITTQTSIAAGASINFKVASTATTSLVGLRITVVLQRLS